MQTDTFDGMVLDDANDMRQYADDNKLVAIFYVNPVHNKTKSTKEGRPIFDDVPYIKILTPGSKDSFHTEIPRLVVDWEVKVDKASGQEQRIPIYGDIDEENIYIKRFPKQWDAFKKNMSTETMSGTPIKEVSWLTASQKAEFQALHVNTVEQLAGMADSMAQKFMGFQQLKTRARAFLEASGKAAAGEKLADELQKRDELIAEQGEALKAMRAELDALKKK